MQEHFRTFGDALISASWLTQERVLRWGIASALVSLAVLAGDTLAHLTHGVTNAAGEQLARDFINYWSGAKLAITGHALQAYDWSAFHLYQQTLVGPASEFKLYGYPPFLMLLCSPLAALPFVPALMLWVVGGISLAALPLAALVGWRSALIALVGAPAAFWNLYAGQTGNFTAALLGGGLLLLERRPIVAGILFGLLACKPQLGLLLPIALACGGYRRAFFSAAATALILVAVSTVLLGPDIWPAFAQQMALQDRLLQAGDSFWPRMPTVFAALRLLGAGNPTAFALQGLSALLAAGIVGVLWRSDCAFGVKSAALIVGAFLATPYAWDYDMIALLFAAAWLAVEARHTGFLSFEKTAVLALLTLPALIVLPVRLNLQIGPLLLWLPMIVLARRGIARALPAPTAGRHAAVSALAPT
jgi:arabinofuranan 3-O-arabinosyltransferase